MGPRPTSSPNLSRREESSPNSCAGPLIGAILGIAIGIFILSLICISTIGAVKRSQLDPQPGTMNPPLSDASSSEAEQHHGWPRHRGGHNTGSPQLPNYRGGHGSGPIHLPVPGPVLLRPTATPRRNNSGAFRFGPGIHPSGARIDHCNRLVPVNPRWAQGCDPRRSRSEHRP